MAAPTGIIKIYNTPRYLKVVNTQTQVTSLLRKSETLCQAMDDSAAANANDSLFLQCNSHTIYFTFDQVLIPKRLNIQLLLRQLLTWLTNDDTFDRLYTDTPVTAVQVKSSYTKSPLGVDEALNTVAPFPAVGGAVVSAANFAPGVALESVVDSAAREILMIAPADTTAAGGGGRIVRQSKMYAACPSDRNMITVITGSLLDPAGLAGATYADALADPATSLAYSVGTRYSMGVFDDARDVLYGASNCGNGVFLQYDFDPARTDYTADAQAQLDLAALSAAEQADYIADWKLNRVWAVFRTNYSGAQVDIRVPQRQWNLDRADSLADGSMFDLDATMHLTAVFKWGVVPGAACTVGLVYQSNITWLHAFDTRETMYHIGTASLPLRWELDNRAGTTDARMRQGRAISSCDGSYSVPGRPLTFDTHLTRRTLNVQRPVPIISFRMNALRNRGHILPQRLNILNVLSAGSCKYELRLNPALTGATWAAGSNYSFDEAAAGTSLSLLDQGSFMEVDTAATAVRGGQTLLSGYVYSSESREIEGAFHDIALCSTIAGRPDVLTLVCTFIAGVCEIAASAMFTEYD